MKKIFLLSILVFATGSIFADGHTAAEKEVLKALAEYFDARNAQIRSKTLILARKTVILTPKFVIFETSGRRRFFRFVRFWIALRHCFRFYRSRIRKTVTDTE